MKVVMFAFFSIMFMLGTIGCELDPQVPVELGKPQLPEQYRNDVWNDDTATVEDEEHKSTPEMPPPMIGQPMFSCLEYEPGTYRVEASVVCDGVPDCPYGSDESQPACDNADGDSLVAWLDNCPAMYNPDQTDTDGDGDGDVCDTDRDGDGRSNYWDPCPDTFVPDHESEGIEECPDIFLVWCYMDERVSAYPEAHGQAIHLSQEKGIMALHVDVPLEEGVIDGHVCAKIRVPDNVPEAYIDATKLNVFTSFGEPHWFGEEEVGAPDIVLIAREAWMNWLSVGVGYYNYNFHGYTVDL
jgi:hypothetical protein